MNTSQAGNAGYEQAPPCPFPLFPFRVFRGEIFFSVPLFLLAFRPVLGYPFGIGAGYQLGKVPCCSVVQSDFYHGTYSQHNNQLFFSYFFFRVFHMFRGEIAESIIRGSIAENSYRAQRVGDWRPGLG